VIVADLKRWDGFRQFIGIYEYVQWIGRAGRDNDVYDQAYAFPMYEDDEAIERFQFDTPVEQKDLEDVQTHLSGQITLRWLVLELVNYGWETDKEVLDFVQSTLFWAETVDQVPEHVRADLQRQPRRKVKRQVQKTLSWLTDHGLLNEPLGQPQAEETRYTATELGSALVEYEHSNWFDNSVKSVLELTEWLNEHGETLTPEVLVERLADEYYHCDETQMVPGDGPLSNKMEVHDLSGTEGVTAMLTCWFWCAGISITDIEDTFKASDLSGLANTTSNLSDAIDSVRILYRPFEMPDEPEWLEQFTSQMSEGVPGPDMYLVANVDYFGRVLYNNLKDQLNRMGTNPDWDPGEEYFIVERLSSLLSARSEDLFKQSVKGTTRIGETISQNILETLKEWNPEDNELPEVPFAESVRERSETSVLTQYHESNNQESNDQADSDEFGSSTGDQTSISDF